MDYHFTANVEKEFDRIAQGEEEWSRMLEDFYGSFHESVETTIKTSEKATGERVLGKDPESGKPVIARIGRYGAMAQIGEASDEDKPKFASLLKNQSIESINLEEALELFKLPRDVGEYESEKVVAAIGRFGPYVRHANKFYSLKGDDDPMTIVIDRAILLIEEKRKLDREKTIKTFEENPDLQVLAGRYGPYISMGRSNYKIPKDVEPKELTLEECLSIIENAPKKKGRGGFRKKKK
jgi:DNA topoisomerase-1